MDDALRIAHGVLSGELVFRYGDERADAVCRALIDAHQRIKELEASQSWRPIESALPSTPSTPRTRPMTRDEAFYLIHKRFGVALLKQDRAKMFADLRSMGFAIVPLEPTEKMLEAARDWSTAKYGKAIGNDGAIGCYRAMIAAYEKDQFKGVER